MEEKVANDGIILNEAQVAALEKKKHDDEACGEIETAHPGYLGSQDTFYVGNLKGVGRIYQQTFVDTYSKIAFCKLYTTKTPTTAADALNDKVLPFFEQQELPMLRILTEQYFLEFITAPILYLGIFKNNLLRNSLYYGCIDIGHKYG